MRHSELFSLYVAYNASSILFKRRTAAYRKENDMSETKFTKGPWEFDKYRNLKAGGNDLKVEGVSIPCGHSSDEVEANMNLIAQAPAMYEMLAKLLVEGGLGTARHRQIDKLLAKCRGEQ